MKIVHLVAGAADMYCGACLQANTLAAALLEAGEDVLVVPLYTPIRTDEPSAAGSRIAFGGVNVYLQQRSALFRHTPWFLDRLLDSNAVLGRLAGRGAAVDPRQLGDLTVSMLRGEEGRQRKELDKLIDWLGREIRPEVVHLSNLLLVGLAREIHRRLGAPVVCSLAGEDLFLAKLAEPHAALARDLLRERAADAAALVAPGRYYAAAMAEYLAIDAARIHVVPPGLNLAGHGTRSSARAGAATIGFFARICPEKGLHQLAEAFAILARDNQLPPLRLRAAGYLADEDRPYLEEVKARLAACQLADRFEYAGSLDRRGKIAFLQSLDVMSVPTVYRESKGISILEAMANAVPVVLPAHGAFPELIAETGGGLLCEPGDPAALAAGLKRMIQDPQLAAECGRRGQEAVRQRYNAQVAARRMRELYGSIVAASCHRTSAS